MAKEREPDLFSTRAEADKSGSATNSDVLIDVHIHLYQTREQGEQMKADFEVWEYGPNSMVQYRPGAGDLEDTLQGLDEAGISRAVAVNTFATIVLDGQLVEEHPRALDGSRVPLDADLARRRLVEYNEWLCEVARETHRIVPFIGVDPWALSGEEIVQHVRYMVRDHAAAGVKIHPAYSRFHATDQRIWPVYEVCAELGVPILSHSGAHPDHYSEPESFTSVLEEFPDLVLVLAHLGGPEWRQVPPLAERFSNVYFDCSELISRIGSGWEDSLTDTELAELIQRVGTDRVMMGSDFPWYDLNDIILRIRNLPILSSDDKQAILGLNAARTLGV